MTETTAAVNIYEAHTHAQRINLPVGDMQVVW